MRYQTRTPLRSRSLNSPCGIALQQRADATCSLSLANVSVGAVGTTSGNSITELNMSTSPTVLVQVASPLTDKPKNFGNVPFPKRPHSLLRGTTPTSRIIGGREGEGQGKLEGDASLADRTLEHTASASASQDSSAQPPRKRTRTCGFSSSSTSTRTRSSSKRLNSTPITPVYAPSIVTELISPDATLGNNTSSSGSSSATFYIVNDAASDTLSLTTSSPKNGILVHHLSSTDELKDSAETVNGTSSAQPRIFWHRRKVDTAEMKVILFLYRTLIYGLEVKYADRHSNSNPGQSESESLLSSSVAQAVSRGQVKSYLDIQDAHLAHNLRSYLLRHGADARNLIVNVEGIHAEAFVSKIASDSTAMEVDMDTPSTPIKLNLSTTALVKSSSSSSSSSSFCSISSNSHNPHTHFLHPHLHLSTTSTILSYSHLVSSLILRRSLQLNRSQQAKGLRSSGLLRPKKSSPLGQVYQC